MAQKSKLVKNSENQKQELPLAKKDFTIRHNNYLREIKKGDDVSDVPVIYLENLKTEGVL
jgi:hypothetical protein